LKLTSLIEGFYNEQSNVLIPDTITVGLRSTVSPYDLIETQKNISNSAGISSLNFYNVYYYTDYYLQIRHRNSLETWAAQVCHLLRLFEFWLVHNHRHMNNMKQKGSRWTYIGVHQDGIIDAGDIINIPRI
jgi:hypothetical protein